MAEGVSWELVAAQVRELAECAPHWSCALANVSALLFEALEGVNWVGFYLTGAFLCDGLPERELFLGSFQGKVACERIPFGRGVCGTAAEADACQRVADVSAFPGHIACDLASRSEIVVPVHVRGQVVGVLDIDSPRLARFDAADEEGLTLCVRALERCLKP